MGSSQLSLSMGMVIFWRKSCKFPFCPSLPSGSVVEGLEGWAGTIWVRFCILTGPFFSSGVKSLLILIWKNFPAQQCLFVSRQFRDLYSTIFWLEPHPKFKQLSYNVIIILSYNINTLCSIRSLHPFLTILFFHHTSFFKWIKVVDFEVNFPAQLEIKPDHDNAC